MTVIVPIPLPAGAAGRGVDGVEWHSRQVLEINQLTQGISNRLCAAIFPLRIGAKTLADRIMTEFFIIPVERDRYLGKVSLPLIIALVNLKTVHVVDANNRNQAHNKSYCHDRHHRNTIIVFLLFHNSILPLFFRRANTRALAAGYILAGEFLFDSDTSTNG